MQLFFYNQNLILILKPKVLAHGFLHVAVLCACVLGGGGGEGEDGLFLVWRWDGLRGDTHLFVPCSAQVAICILISF